MSSTPIKDVTRALQALLLSQLNPGGGTTAQVSLVPPGETLPSGLGVNLYLYRVVESPSTKNQPWPGDRLRPPARTPALGLELSYLLTPFAGVPDATSPSGDDAHTVLGAAMLTFHENPVLNDIHISGFDADTVLSADLLDSFEQIKIRLAHTTLEELSKIWATINQPYRLSVAYDVSLVMVTPAAPTPSNGAIVTTAALSVVPWSAPSLDTLTPAAGPLAHVDAGGAIAANQLTIGGSGMAMAGQTPGVALGGQSVTVATAPPATDSSLTIFMPLAVDAGPSVDVAVSLGGKAGAPLTFEVTPWLAGISPLRTALDAAPLLTLIGEGFTATPKAVRFDGPPGTIIVTVFVGTPADREIQLTIPAALANGTYDVRVVLNDGPQSVSNSRALRVIPLLAPFIALSTVTLGTKQVHRLTLNGARLNGTDVRVIIDGAEYAAGPNGNAAQLVFTFGRLLATGSHNVGVSVDGSTSHTAILQVP